MVARFVSTYRHLINFLLQNYPNRIARTAGFQQWTIEISFVHSTRAIRIVLFFIKKFVTLYLKFLSHNYAYDRQQFHAYV